MTSESPFVQALSAQRPRLYLRRCGPGRNSGGGDSRIRVPIPGAWNEAEGK